MNKEKRKYRSLINFLQEQQFTAIQQVTTEFIYIRTLIQK